MINPGLLRPIAVLGNLRAHKVLDVPSIQLAAGIVGGVGLGALLAAVSAGLHTLGEAGLQALSEGDGGNAKVAERVLPGPVGGSVTPLDGPRALHLASLRPSSAYWLLQSYGVWMALLGVIGTAIAYAIAATIAGRRRSTAFGPGDLARLEVVDGPWIWFSPLLRHP